MRRMDEASPAILLSRLKELRDLLQSPGGEQQEQRVNALAIFIARRAPNPSIREYFDLNALLEQLRVALEEAADKPRR
jgi:hypothetical protein